MAATVILLEGIFWPGGKGFEPDNVVHRASHRVRSVSEETVDVRAVGRFAEEGVYSVEHRLLLGACSSRAVTSLQLLI
jgi:hypothetical protein